MSNFWNSFYEQPLDEIPWHKTQADYFVQLVETGMIKGNSALDLGCGVGAKSIFLAQHGFSEVVGVDIAEQAIRYAKQNAVDAGVAEQCSFYAHDATDLSCLSADAQFDLVLDWAVLHCVPVARRAAYVSGVIERIKPGGHFLLRTFSSEEGVTSFVETINDQSEAVSVFSRSTVLELFAGLKMIEGNTSQPRTKPELQFLELLFQKGK